MLNRRPPIQDYSVVQHQRHERWLLTHVNLLPDSYLGTNCRTPRPINSRRKNKMENRPLTARDVPPRFLNSTLFVGHIPYRALTSDPRVSYALYVPPQHYSYGAGTPPARVKVPLLVSVHGTRRDVHTIYELAPFADSTGCAILAPLFPTGLDGPDDIDSYKLLRSTTLRSDLALLSMLDEVAVRWPDIDTDKIFLAGFSGGGQFAHRFLYLYPERLAAVSVGAPGHATVLDEQKSWPVGVKDVDAVFGKSIDKALIRKVPIHLVIGSADVKVHGGEEFWAWMRQFKAQRGAGSAVANDTPTLLPIDQGRLETMHQLRGLWGRDGIEAQLDVVEGVSHDARGVRDAVLQFLESRLRMRLGECSS
ncbi:alpha/beta-hydrolase [Annulohypoxylon maeteangense]|uniref:alpha/beta-hydrolase n=1 Tax=Annulohypoxylon maeteangense TaxID=1927788 RepID=UPI0020088170|nr:alpha/beta-hydrolase [Annulohypoxylon maeteangense]KAI0882302.1 alpha/beta-hydrolase [Annulohypoxylon maeteangense]